MVFRGDGRLGARVSSTVEIQAYREIGGGPSRAAGPVAIRAGDAARLMSPQGPLSPAARAGLRAQEGFPAAIRKSARGMLELHRGNRLLNLIVSDRGRFLVTLIALDLHFSRGETGVGLVPGRLRRVCAETGTCSPGRASALLTLMRLAEFVVPAPAAKDRRLCELVPTERLVASQRERWRCHLEAVAPLLPEAARGLAQLDRPEFMAEMVRQACAYYYAGFRPMEHVPALRLFGERTGGMFVVLSLLAAGDDEADRRGDPVAVSITELARRIGTSRTHILRLLSDAAAAGLLERDGANGIVVLPALREAAYDFFALVLLFLTHCANVARERA